MGADHGVLKLVSHIFEVLNMFLGICCIISTFTHILHGLLVIVYTEVAFCALGHPTAGPLTWYVRFASMTGVLTLNTDMFLCVSFSFRSMGS